MKIDNETEEEIDYNQTGGGADDDEVKTLGHEGTLLPGATVTFPPAGPLDYVVTLRGVPPSTACCRVICRDPGTEIRVLDLGTCSITVDPEPNFQGNCPG